MTAADTLTAALRSPKHAPAPALMPYLTSGYPTMEGFASLVESVSEVADAMEIGVPFTDPMADGVTIQGSSHVALKNGVSLKWILETLKGVDAKAPMVLMSYLNPLMRYGLERVVRDAADAGVSGFIVPDLPFEECDMLRDPADEAGLAVVQLVTPVTPADRLAMLCRESRGFVYAVTKTGVTGGQVDSAPVGEFLDGIRAVSPLPVCAGFGIRSATQIKELTGHADGAIVGSAFIEALGDGANGAEWLRGLVPA
ncbi:MAG: tryptophan synthase subunit alpha [Deltaproteobacteria bacterium]|nr:MAG: tryptophan synthase subunit alpha [Deltaproteobacteria bacterium]